MTNSELRQLLIDYRDLSVLEKQTASEKKAIAEKVQAYLTEAGEDELNFADVRATWRECETTRIDSKRLREALPEVYAAFSAVSVSRRFLVS